MVNYSYIQAVSGLRSMRLTLTRTFVKKFSLIVDIIN